MFDLGGKQETVFGDEQVNPSERFLMLTGPVDTIYFIFSVENTDKMEKRVCAGVYVCVHMVVYVVLLEESLNLGW